MTQNNAVRGAEIERCVHAPDGVIQISAAWLPLRDHRAAFAGRNTEYRNTGQRIYALTKEVTNEPVFMPGSSREYRVPDRASSKGCTIQQVEILSNKLLTTAFEASLECITVM